MLIHNFLLQYTVNKNVVLLQEEFEDTKRVKEAVKTEEGQKTQWSKEEKGQQHQHYTET